MKETEFLKPWQFFSERFPYWTSPFGPRTTQDFKVGQRVINMNSVMRQYIPFGLRGTVIGKTEEKVMVMFDEQFIGGQNIYGQCENYRGALVRPDYILNITKKFESILKK